MISVIVEWGIQYVYAPDGTKLRTVHKVSGIGGSVTRDTTDYYGNLVLRNGHLSIYRFDGGYVSFSNDTIDGWHYYIQDYMGNNRMVVNSDGTIEQVTHYYPYGGVIGDISTNENLQKYKFEGKELDRTFGLDNYDIHARQYFAMAPMWDRIDPLAEKYYGISPYAFCGGDPVNKMDNTGLFPDSTRAVVAQQINEVINNTWFGSGSTGVVRKLEDSENYKASDENSYYVMNCEYNEDTGEYVATAEFAMDKTPITIAGYASTAIEIAGYAMFLSPETACFAPEVVSIGKGLGSFSFALDQATDYVNGDLSVISFGAAMALKKGHDGLGALIQKYIPSTGYSSVNNEAHNLLKIINSMYSVATGFIPEAIKEKKEK